VEDFDCNQLISDGVMNLADLLDARGQCLVVNNCVSNYNITLQARVTESPGLAANRKTPVPVPRVCALHLPSPQHIKKVPADRAALNFESMQHSMK